MRTQEEKNLIQFKTSSIISKPSKMAFDDIRWRFHFGKINFHLMLFAHYHYHPNSVRMVNSNTREKRSSTHRWLSSSYRTTMLSLRRSSALQLCVCRWINFSHSRLCRWTFLDIQSRNWDSRSFSSSLPYHQTLLRDLRNYNKNSKKKQLWLFFADEI